MSLKDRLELAAQACRAAHLLSCEATCREAAQAVGAEATPDSKPWDWPLSTVGKLMASLKTLPADMPLYTAYFVEIDGVRIAKTIGPSLSKETVFDGRIQKFEKPGNAVVIWANQLGDHAVGASAAPSVDLMAELKKRGVPVAWRWKRKASKKWHYEDTPWTDLDDSEEQEPLYTSIGGYVQPESKP